MDLSIILYYTSQQRLDRSNRDSFLLKSHSKMHDQLPIRSGDFWFPGLLAVNTESRAAMMKHYTYYVATECKCYSQDPVLLDYSRGLFPFEKLSRIVYTNHEFTFVQMPPLAQKVFYLEGDLEVGLFWNEIEYCDEVLEHLQLECLRKLYMAKRDTQGKKFDIEDWILVWEDGKWDAELCKKWRELDCVIEQVDPFKYGNPFGG